MRRNKSAPSTYFSAPPPDYAQPADTSSQLSPRTRNIALACTAVAMLGVGGVLGGVAWYAQQSAEEAPLAITRLGASSSDAEVQTASATGDVAVTTEASQEGGTPSAAEPNVAAASTPTPVRELAATAAADDKVKALIGENDPRWARDVVPAAAVLSTGLADAANARAYADRTESPAWQALRDVVAKETGGDSAAKPAIAEAEAPKPATAEDDETVQTAAIGPEPEPEPVKAAEPAPEPARVESSGAAPTGTARIAKGVNMRSAGRKGSRVMGTIPSGATVQLVSCDVWCEVIHNGRRGFVYKDFVQREAAKPVAAAKPAKPEKPEIVPAEMLPQAAQRSGR